MHISGYSLDDALQQHTLSSAALVFQRFEVSNPDRIKAPWNAVAVLWLIICLAGCVVLVAGSPVRSQCRFPGLQACWMKLIKTPSVSFCFGLRWTVEPYLFLDFGRESSTIQYVKSEQQLFALGVGDTGEDASPNDGPRQEQCGVWSLLC